MLSKNWWISPASESSGKELRWLLFIPFKACRIDNWFYPRSRENAPPLPLDEREWPGLGLWPRMFSAASPCISRMSLIGGEAMEFLEYELYWNGEIDGMRIGFYTGDIILSRSFLFNFWNRRPVSLDCNSVYRISLEYRSKFKGSMVLAAIEPDLPPKL